MNRTVTQQRTGGRASRALKSITAIAALACAAPSMAGLVNFESLPADIFESGVTIEENGYAMLFTEGPFAASFGVVGLTGAVIDDDNALSCDLIACPSAASGNFLAVLNDGGVTFSQGNKQGGFYLNGLRVAFVAPLGNQPDGNYAQLTLTGWLYDGSTRSTTVALPTQDAGGMFTFGAGALDAAFRKQVFSSLSVSACLFDGIGGCYNSVDNPGMNQAQFALDDISFADVPEPGSFFLIGLGITALGLTRRRAAKAAATTATVHA